MSTKAKYFLAFFAIAYPLDQLSKGWVIAQLYYGEVVPLIPGVLDLTHVRNPGAAFSLFASMSFELRMIFFVGTGILAVGLLFAFFRGLEPGARLTAAALGGILGGALGNLTDRLVHHEVIDFIDVHLGPSYTWPTFNFADSFIVVGVGLLILEVFWNDDGAEAEAEAEAEAGAGEVHPS